MIRNISTGGILAVVGLLAVSMFMPISGASGLGIGCTITGTEADDVLVGTNGDDVICGLGGADIIDAGAGDDIVYGDGGDDNIDAGPGVDVVFGGPPRR